MVAVVIISEQCFHILLKKINHASLTSHCMRSEFVGRGPSRAVRAILAAVILYYYYCSIHKKRKGYCGTKSPSAACQTDRLRLLPTACCHPPAAFVKTRAGRTILLPELQQAPRGRDRAKEAGGNCVNTLHITYLSPKQNSSIYDERGGRDPCLRRHLRD